MATTQADLKRLAQKHRENPAVRALITSMLECEIQAKQHMGAVTGHVGVAERALEGDDGFKVVLDQADLVLHASKAATALSRLAGDYMTLACVLSGLGEQIDGY